MKKKLMMVAVLLGALSLGACVDDNESASVTDLRGAKAEQLRALATLNEAKAEAETIRANAEAALLQAQANYEQAKADSMGIYNDKAEQKYALELEKLHAKLDLEILQAQEALAQYQEDALTRKYASELCKLLNLQDQLIDKKVLLAKAEAGLANTEASNAYIILDEESKIAGYNAQIAVLQDENYASLDDTELIAEIATKEQELKLLQASLMTEPAYTALSEKGQKVLDAYELVKEQNELLKKINQNTEAQGVIVNGEGGSNKTKVYYTVVKTDVNGKLSLDKTSKVRVLENARISEVNKLAADQACDDAVAHAEAELGKNTDKADATYKYTYTDESDQEQTVTGSTAYSLRAAAADLKAEADELKKKFEAIGDDDELTVTIDDVEYTWTKERGLEEANRMAAKAEKDDADADDKIAIAENKVKAAIAARDEYKEALASIDLTAYNQAVADLKAASDEVDAAYPAYMEAQEPITELTNEIAALNLLATDGSIDIDGEIASLQANIAYSEKVIAELQADQIDSAWMIDYYNAQIEGLELRIAAQQQIVNAAKEALEATINSDDTETPETPSEEQPAEETPAA